SPDVPARARVWDGDGRLLYERGAGAGRLFFRDGKPLALTSPDTLAVKDLERGQLLDTVAPAGPPPLTNQRHPGRFAFSDDGRLCAESGMWGEIALWELTAPQRTLRAVVRRDGGRGRNRSGQDLKAFSPDGSQLAAFDGPDLLKVWDTRDGKEVG